MKISKNKSFIIICIVPVEGWLAVLGGVGQTSIIDPLTVLIEQIVGTNYNPQQQPP